MVRDSVGCGVVHFELSDWVVSVSKDEGPIKLRGKFAGGNGGVETRELKMKNIYSLSAVKPGLSADCGSSWRNR